jgi:D-alanyl-D-alanine carboxypeptidase
MRTKEIAMVIAVLAMILSPQGAEAKRLHHAHHRARHHVHASVDRSAAYADIVIDAETGQILHEADSEDLRHPASLTKMMTLYLAFQALESGRLGLNQYLRVSENASYQLPSKLGVRAGQRLRVEDAILGIITESANDAAVVLAEAMGGSESGFANMMTREAHALGMTRTQFRNASGLPDPAQVTTARDMAILGAVLVNHYPQYYPYFSRESFTYAGIYHHNHNHLMDRYDGMDGIKTGYIRASGFNLVASVKRDDKRLVGVIFGGRSAVGRDNHMAHLLDLSFAVAQNESRPQRLASIQAEGDSADSDSEGEVVLPAKLAALSPAGGIEDAQAYPRQARLEAPRFPVSSKARAGGGTWGVQIGAYSNPTMSHQALTSLVSNLSRLPSNPEPQVQEIAAGGGAVMYRARLMSLDKKTAQNICAYLTRQGKSCLTVEP